jgi:hypothetical protein
MLYKGNVTPHFNSNSGSGWDINIYVQFTFIFWMDKFRSYYKIGKSDIKN